MKINNVVKKTMFWAIVEALGLFIVWPLGILRLSQGHYGWAALELGLGIFILYRNSK